MFKIVIIGYGEMMASLALGVKESPHELVGVVLGQDLKKNFLWLKIKNFFNPDCDFSFLKAHGIKQIFCKSVNDEQFKKQMLKLNPDIILIGSLGEILKKDIINLPKIATINTHPSLLPKYRGSNPYYWTIKNGEMTTGLTFHLVDENIDTGAILLQREIKIYPTDTGNELKNRTAKEAQKAVVELLENLENDFVIPIKQSEEKSSYFRALSYKDLLIDFNTNSNEINNHLRASIPWIKNYFYFKNKFFGFKSYDIEENKTNFSDSKTIVDKTMNSISILTKDNKVIRFNDVKILGFQGVFTPLFLKHFVKIGEKLK